MNMNQLNLYTSITKHSFSVFPATWIVTRAASPTCGTFVATSRAKFYRRPINLPIVLKWAYGTFNHSNTILNILKDFTLLLDTKNLKLTRRQP